MSRWGGGACWPGAGGSIGAAKAEPDGHDGANPLTRGTAREVTDAMGASVVRLMVATPGQALAF